MPPESVAPDESDDRDYISNTVREGAGIATCLRCGALTLTRFAYVHIEWHDKRGEHDPIIPPWS